jgi:steroid 5-alpha reductase family enzyme
VDTIWTFSLGLVGAGSALWPVAGASPNARQSLVAALVPPLEAQMLRWRGDRYRDYQSRTSQFFPLPPQA